MGETPAEAARRELWEETGICGRVTRLLGIWDSRLSHSRTKAQMYHVVFLVDPNSGLPRPSPEAVEVAFFAEDGLPHLSPGHHIRAPLVFKLSRGEVPAPYFDPVSDDAGCGDGSGTWGTGGTSQERHMARVVFMGSPDFALPTLRRLVDDGYEIAGVYTQPDREAGRGRALTPPPVKGFALERGLPVYQPASLRREAAVEELRALAPDVIVVAAYGQILRRPVLDIPPFGVLNVHASLLPRWRGAAPVQAAILAGDRETGVTIMQIAEGLDTGPLLTRRTTRISELDTAGTLTPRLAEMGADLLVETLPAWLTGEITPEPQDEARASYAPRVEKESGRLDWVLPAADLWRRVRAYTPWPGAFTLLRGELLRLHEVWPIPGEELAPPGTVVPLPPDAREAVPLERPHAAFAVQTGEGLLLPLKLQRAGRRALFAAEFLRGERDLIGARLG